MAKRFDRNKYLSIGFSGVKSTAAPGYLSASDEAPIGAHLASSLPRWTKHHKGAFTKNGTAIVKNKNERDHIEGSSGGRYKFNADTD